MLLPYTLILHAAGWLTRLPDNISTNCWIYAKLIRSLQLSYAFENILSVVFILIQAILIGRITSKYKLNPDGQLFGSLFFILFCGMNGSTLNLNATLIANLFLTLAIHELFGIYQKKNANISLFNFGFLIGIASLFYLPYYNFLLLGCIGIVIMRRTLLKEIFQITGGFINVYLLLFAILYILGQHSEFWDHQISGFFSPFIFSMNFQGKGWVIFGILFILLLIIISQYQYFQTKRSIIVQKLADLCFWTIFIGLWSFFFLKIQQVHHIIILFTPLALLSGMLLSKLKNPLIKETLHLFLVITALFLQFQNW